MNVSEVDGILALLLLLVVAVAWLTIEVKRVHDTVAPLAESTLATAIARV